MCYSSRPLAARQISKCPLLTTDPRDSLLIIGILDESIEFLQKPFITKDLAAKLNAALGKGSDLAATG